MPGVAAIILAAGESTRMGAPKALLPDADGRPFVARIVRTFVEAGIRRVTIVAGSQLAAIARALEADDAAAHPRLVVNPDPSRGQLSSLLVGLDAVPSDVEAALVTLVDVPLVASSTVREVVAAWERTRAPVVRPAMGTRHGHPVLFDRAVFDELRRAPLDEGAKSVVHAHADDLVNIAVNDEGCVTDVDTPEDYKRLVKRT